MYKIYLNEKEILIDSWSADSNIYSGQLSDKVLPFKADRDYLKKWTTRNQYPAQRIVFMAEDLEYAFHYFQQTFKVIVAAGGLVINQDKEVLAIFRKGQWDLPKGKVDKGETLEQAALREVEEETGIKAYMRHYLGDTYHIYKLKNKWIFKISKWYVMSGDKQPISVQTEEDIETGEWVNPEKLLSYRPIYPNILNILNSYLGLNSEEEMK